MTAIVAYTNKQITVKRQGAFKTIPVRKNIKRSLKNVIVNLSNMGYRVIVLEEGERVSDYM